MQTAHPNYYILAKEKKRVSKWSLFFRFLDYIRLPFSISNAALTFLLSRAVTNIALAPNEVKPQKPVHLVYLTYDPEEKGSVIINVLPHRAGHVLLSYMSHIGSLLPSVVPELVSRNDRAYQIYMDSIIDEIGYLLDGMSTQDKCPGKRFIPPEIYIKGLEGLDLPALNYFLDMVRHRFGADFFDVPRNNHLNFFTLELQDEAILDSMEILAPNEQDKPMAERRFVISCLARDQNYMQWTRDFNYMASTVGCTVIAFNYRGADYSKGMVWSQESMMRDVLAQVERLLALGATAENIGLEGMCLGGAIATLVAAELHAKGLRVSLYNERSFRSIIRLVTGYIAPAAGSSIWNPLTLFKYLGVGATYVTVAPLIKSVGWHVNAARAWNRIPDEYKNYSVVRGPDGTDEFIHDSWASMASMMDAAATSLYNKQAAGKVITDEERQFLAEHSEHEFELNPDPGNSISVAHFASRHYLVQSKSDTNGQIATMQDYAARSLVHPK